MRVARSSSRLTSTALALLLVLPTPWSFAEPAGARGEARPVVTAQPASDKPLPQHEGIHAEVPQLTQEQLVELLRLNIK
jgi:hypothetical protein